MKLHDLTWGERIIFSVFSIAGQGRDFMLKSMLFALATLQLLASQRAVCPGYVF